MTAGCEAAPALPATGRAGARRAVLMWSVAVLAYGLGVTHRSSLAVAGLDAAERFGLSATELANFAVLQLLVYAVMQVPVGLLVDRYGPRAVLISGTTLLTVAQLVFALTEVYAWALLARVLVGVGDALTFICVLRLVASWFPAARIPVFTALTGTVGQCGAIVAALPMTWALQHWGWTATYLVLMSVGVPLVLALALVLHDSPTLRRSRGPVVEPAAVLRSLRDSWRRPGTRVAFWIHFSVPISTNAVVLLWGQPFIVLHEGRSPETAALLLSVVTVVVVVYSPVVGLITSRRPSWRTGVVLGVLGATVLAWTAVLAWPGQAPVWLLLVWAVVMGLGGPTAMFSFEYVRLANPPARFASATGIVNQAGFVATLVFVLAAGWIVDHLSPAGGPYSASGLGWAMTFQYLLWALGAFQIVRWMRRSAAAAPPPGTRATTLT